MEPTFFLFFLVCTCFKFDSCPLSEWRLGYLPFLAASQLLVPCSSLNYSSRRRLWHRTAATATAATAAASSSLALLKMKAVALRRQVRRAKLSERATYGAAAAAVRGAAMAVCMAGSYPTTKSCQLREEVAVSV